MNKAIASICLLFISGCYGQVDDPANTVTYELALKDNTSSITISVNKAWKNERKLLFKTETRLENNQNGVSMRFSDNDLLRFSDQVLRFEDLGGGNKSVSAEIYLTDELYDKISRVAMVEFSLGNIKVPVIYQGEESLQKLAGFINRD